MLRRLDDARAAAFASGRPAALAHSYLPGSGVLRRDRAVLDAYARRGLRVHGADLRLLRVRVLARGHRRVVLRVVDRLGPATVTARAGAALALPRDHPTVHRLVLRRTDPGWRIAGVRALTG